MQLIIIIQINMEVHKLLMSFELAFIFLYEIKIYKLGRVCLFSQISIKKKFVTYNLFIFLHIMHGLFDCVLENSKVFFILKT